MRSVDAHHTQALSIHIPRMMPIMRGWGMADLIFKESSYSALSFFVFFCVKGDGGRKGNQIHAEHNDGNVDFNSTNVHLNV